MLHHVMDVTLRPPEPRDVPRLFEYKNDPDIARLLGGFHTGLAERDIVEWVERRRSNRDDVVWVIADGSDDCIGHVGLYKIDLRVRSAEFAIMIGDKKRWGRGLGAKVTRYMVDWGFNNLNLNRVELSVLEVNERAARLYRSLGFVVEGTLRQAQYKDGHYLNVILMSLLRSEWSQCP